MTLDRRAVTPADLAARIEAAASRLAHDPAAAEQQAKAVLAAAPNDPRAALILASARRRLGDPAGAMTILETLARAFPRAAHTQYELGLARAALGNSAGALAALGLATSLKPDLAEAWRALGDLLFKTGDAAGARAAFAEHARAAVQNPALKPAANDIFAGRLAEAEQRLRAYLLGHRTEAAALNLLADVLIRLGRHPEAETLAGYALAADTDFDGARFTYATALFHQQKAVQALPHLRQLLARSPDDPAYLNLTAACLGLIGDFDEVEAIQARLLSAYPDQPDLWLNHAHALRTVGRGVESARAYRRCIALAPLTGEAYWGLANLKVARFSEAEAGAMLALLDRPDLTAPDRLHLEYALGKAFEDRGDDEAAFAHYAAGARLRRDTTPYEADATTARVRVAEALFTREFLEARRGAGSASEAPIFIVGLPRSGSTLIEQILASHPEVEGTMELPDIGFIAAALARPQPGRAAPLYPEMLATLDPARLAELGQAYLDATQVHRKQGRPFFIDKMPNNFQHLGLIHLILPGAKIIDARRHPMAACFSAFKQHFNQGQDFSYDLDDLGRYYVDYARLTAHFDAALPGRVHRVIYEDLVEDTEGEVRRLLDHCGLAFDPACLRFYENDRAVRTVSSEQVRRPIFREGLEQWRRFEPWLGPLARALGPVLHDWRGETSILTTPAAEAVTPAGALCSMS